MAKLYWQSRWENPLIGEAKGERTTYSLFKKSDTEFYLSGLKRGKTFKSAAEAQKYAQEKEDKLNG